MMTITMQDNELKMIAVDAAKEIILSRVETLPPIEMSVANAYGLLIADDISAPNDIPAYPQSSMDGYAIKFNGSKGPFKLVAESAAGNSTALKLKPHEAVRIFTGAPVPEGADTIIVQERAVVKDEELFYEDHPVSVGQHIRPVGSEIGKGDLAAKAYERVTAAMAGFLCGIGIEKIRVVPLPVVHILVTGNELQTPGLPLQYGQVYESNSATLKAALAAYGIKNCIVKRIGDDPQKMTVELSESLALADIVLMTGGVSVGNYDFTKSSFIANDVELIFHKIRQKPGKPILFGAKGAKVLFGLPGNPASVLTCFYEYVTLAIEKMALLPASIKPATLKSQNGYKKPSGITHFLKAIAEKENVALLGGQESYKLNSFSKANCLAVIPEEVTEIKEGDELLVHLLNS